MQEVQREVQQVQDEVQQVAKTPMMHQTFDGNDQHLQEKTREEMPPQPPQASSNQIQTKMMIPKRQMDCCFVFF